MSARAACIAVALVLGVGGFAAFGPDVELPAKEGWESKAGLVERGGARSMGGLS